MHKKLQYCRSYIGKEKIIKGERMYKFIETFRGIYDVFIMAVVIIIAIILICVEIPRLTKAQLVKEIMVAKVLAATYIVVGITAYILLQIT